MGVQRGLVRWFLHLHSPSHRFGISPEKVGASASKESKLKNPTVSDELPSLNDLEEENGEAGTSLSTVAERTNSVVPPTFTPSIKQTLDKPATKPGVLPVPLPSGIDVLLLKSRLNGKKIK